MGAIHETLLAVGLLIVGAKLAEGITQRLRLNSIVAYTATGVLLGPVAGVIELTPELHVLLRIGLFLLFFLVGLDEIDVAGVIETVRGRLLIFALISLLIPMSLCFLVTSDTLFDFGLGLSARGALSLATILSLSSLGIVAKVLADEGRLRTPLGIQIFTTVLIIKLLGLPLVGFTLDEHGQALDPFGTLLLIGNIAGFTIVTYLISNRLLPRIFVMLKRSLRVPQLSFGLVLGGLFLMVATAEAMNLHGSLGALLFGAALCGLPFQVRRDVVPGMRSIADGLFVPLFFASGGLQLSFSFAQLPLGAIAALVLVPLLAKLAGPLLGAFVTRMENPMTLAAGLMAKGITEVALLLVLVETGLIGRDLFSLLILVMFVYVVASPQLISLAVRRTKVRDNVEPAGRVPSSMARFALMDITVDDILDRARAFPSPKLSVREFAEQWVVSHQHEYLVASNGKLFGLVSVSMLRYLPKAEWAKTPLVKVVRRSTPKAWPDEHVEDVLHRMQELSLTALPVLDRESNALIGSVTSQEIHELITMDIGGKH